MRKILLLLIIVLLIISQSCSDEFSINAPVKDFYVLNCILRNDSLTQYAIISQNVYTEDGTKPQDNLNQNIPGLNINIINNDSLFVMRDTTIQVTADGGIKNINCYYVKNINMVPGSFISIEAIVPGGEVLKSTVRIPKISSQNIQLDFPQLFNSGYSLLPSYNWSWIGETEEDRDIFNIPQLEIEYKKTTNNISTLKKEYVPLAYYYVLDENDNISPVKVKFSSNDFCLTQFETINQAFHNISKNDNKKNNYVITKVSFDVICFDPDLAKFYSAYNTYSEDFTIKLRQTDYSNIEGGKGIFGVCYNFSHTLEVDKLYIQSFGYKYEP